VRVIEQMHLVAVSRFFENLTQMNFAENKNMRRSPLAQPNSRFYAGGYMKGGKKKNLQWHLVVYLHHPAADLGKAVQLVWAPILGGVMSVSESPASPQG
jgi:hypothetical protein